VEKYLKTLPFFGVFMLASVMTSILPSAVLAQCRLCAPSNDIPTTTVSNPETERPLHIEITTNLDFSRLALVNRSGGEVSIDPVSGNRQINGALTSLGGLSLTGEGRLQGEPGRYVRVYLPDRIQLSAANGSTAELVKLDTDLPAQAQLDPNGRLTFSFGGKLRVTGNAGGQYRGRIAITAEYE
jgi:hypothetical protein